MEKFRKIYLEIAEMIDMFRLVPRLLVVGYCFTLYRVVDWYMALEPYIPDEIKPLLAELINMGKSVEELMVQAPTTQHTALVSAVVGISAAVFGLYASTGVKWSEYKLTAWKIKNTDSSANNNNTDNTSD